MNVDKRTLPIQKVPLSQKDTEWKETSLDAIISRSSSGEFGGSFHNKTDMMLAYGLYNSEYDEEDLKYVTNPYKVEDGFPAKTQDFNIIRPKIDLLIGEESKRPFNIKVVQTNKEVVSQLQDEKKKLLTQYIMSKLGIGGETDESGQPLTPEEIQKYMSYNYKTIAEETAYHTLNYLKEKLNLKNEFIKGWRDGLIGGKEFYYVGMINGEPTLEQVNPMYCDWDKDPDLEFIEDGDWFVRRMEMSPATIYDRFFDIMDESDLDALLEYTDGTRSTGRPDQVNNPSVMYKENFSSRFFDDNSGDNSLITVYHGTWRSYKKIGFLTIEDPETGEENVVMIDETYKPEKGEKVEWDWIPEVWEGWKIGDSIYIGIAPVEYQHVSVDNPSSRKLPYCGVIYSNTNSRSKSLVNLMKPLQYMYIILWYRLELALARDKGKVINMDITQIPKGLGIDVNQWMHYVSALGVNFVNPYDEGWDIPGREGGKPSGFNQITAVDLTMGNVMAEYMNLMAKVEEMIGEISGVSKQRQGSIQQRELVGNVERSVIQSSHITEPLFWTHNLAKRNALTMLLDTAKHAWATKGKQNIHYMLNDTARIFLEVEPDFVYADLDIFLSDSTEESRDIESLRTLLQPAMQNGASLSEAAEIISADNFTIIKKKLEEVDKKREAMMQQQQQAEMQQAQMQMQMEQEKNRIEEEDSMRKAQTQILIAQIKAESDGGEVEDNSLDFAKLEAQIQKQKADAEIKRKQVNETIRKDKKAEAQRQQEIEIKRKQANKPVATKTS
jgi:hypothetical protein